MGPEVLFAHQGKLLVSLLEELPLDQAEPVHEEDPVEMVDFVLKGAGQEPRCFDLQRTTVAVQRLQEHPLRPLHHGGILGHAQAAFLALDIALPLGNLGIDQREERVLRFRVADIDDDQPARHPYLRRCEANPRRGVHRLDHVIYQPLYTSINILNRDRHLLEHWIGIFSYRKHGHAELYHENMDKAEAFTAGKTYVKDLQQMRRRHIPPAASAPTGQ